jgi:hypothetical protein
MAGIILSSGFIFSVRRPIPPASRFHPIDEEYSDGKWIVLSPGSARTASSRSGPPSLLEGDLVCVACAARTFSPAPRG